ncbi:Protein of unknown function [Pyronema omphalodes CBS 100304]|uniref:Uncharacterized protein n=1 Tax=Pyronema omphalodes (strain CBS 100304) TaxID=1076935 RepID=U4LJN3_PYROM|nr:Protein of unknown function [Pyronema omphalodes CBS 100304]
MVRQMKKGVTIFEGPRPQVDDLFVYHMYADIIVKREARSASLRRPICAVLTQNLRQLYSCFISGDSGDHWWPGCDFCGCGCG